MTEDGQAEVNDQEAKSNRGDVQNLILMLLLAVIALAVVISATLWTV